MNSYGIQCVPSRGVLTSAWIQTCQAFQRRFIGLGFIVSAAMLATSAYAGDICNNYNQFKVVNTPTVQTHCFIGHAHVTQVITYHFNNGLGAVPGTITLRHWSGQKVGDYPAHGDTGLTGVPSLNWIADVNIDLPADTYFVIDSDWNTWSQNSQSGGWGFAKVLGSFIPLPPPPPAAPSPPASGFKPCFINSGGAASMGPCRGKKGSVILIETSKVRRPLKSPFVEVDFYYVGGGTGLPSATPVYVPGIPSGGGVAPGSLYSLSAPPGLCIAGNGSMWAAFPRDAMGTVYGNIGIFTIDCR